MAAADKLKPAEQPARGARGQMGKENQAPFFCWTKKGGRPVIAEIVF